MRHPGAKRRVSDDTVRRLLERAFNILLHDTGPSIGERQRAWVYLKAEFEAILNPRRTTRKRT